LSVLTELDCLASLAIVSGQSDTPMCRPIFREEEESKQPRQFIDIKQMVHPCVTMTGSKNFIPNDTLIDTGNSQSLLLVTGPNMGGKSTLLRQTCIAVILAQLGCYVPATHCELTLVDRIFTRIGASDRILEGKSTFYVEMEETRNVLKFATNRSLAILDELGRGTSTFDGYSIAHAVMRYLVNQLHCRTLFSTHYHMLLDEFQNYPGV
jgi:DNA mismatch repair protein MSH6